MTRKRSDNTTMFLRQSYQRLIVSCIQDWIKVPTNDRGILRRLDYAYGLTLNDDKTINAADVNNDGLLAILRQEANRHTSDNVQELIDEIKQRCLAIKKLLLLFMIADYDEFSYRCHDFLLSTLQLQDNPLDTTKIYYNNKNTISFRLRQYPHANYQGYADFFHIPFNLRYLTGTYRYSIPGYPSVYTASSIYCAWEELGKPINNEIGIFAFKALRGMRLLDLRFRFDIPSKNATTDIANYLLTLPLILACSMHVKNENEKFIPEYVLPQQVFKCLMSKMISAYNANDSRKPLMGIAYTSAKTEIWNQLLAQTIQINDTTNYALLAYLKENQTNAKYSVKLAKNLWGRNALWATLTGNDAADKATLDGIQISLSDKNGWSHMENHI